MVTQAEMPQGRSLLGLRPPADLAEETLPRAVAPAPPAPDPAPAPPPAAKRASYPVISSGWDSEDAEGRGKSSDLGAALRAGAVLLVVIIALSLLLR
jgi:hypothetical protein